MRAPRRLVLLSCLAAAGCELQEVTVADPEPFIVVESYLFTDWSFQWVALHGGGFAPNPLVDGAFVELTGPAGTVQLGQYPPHFCTVPSFDTAELPAGFACYATVDSSYVVEPGALYRLTVTLADGSTLRGATRVPAEFDVREEGSTCFLPPWTQRELIWGRSSGAIGYLIEVRAFGLEEALAEEGIEVDLSDPVVLRGLSVSATDTTIVLPGEIGVFDRFTLDPGLLLALQRGVPEGVALSITVGAMDQNFVNWARGGDFNPSGLVRVPSVSGPNGTGVFASATTRRFEASTDSSASEADLCGHAVPD